MGITPARRLSRIHTPKAASGRMASWRKPTAGLQAPAYGVSGHSGIPVSGGQTVPLVDGGSDNADHRPRGPGLPERFKTSDAIGRGRGGWDSAARTESHFG
jgi:hypothetical protein